MNNGLNEWLLVKTRKILSWGQPYINYTYYQLNSPHFGEICRAPIYKQWVCTNIQSFVNYDYNFSYISPNIFQFAIKLSYRVEILNIITKCNINSNLHHLHAYIWEISQSLCALDKLNAHLIKTKTNASSSVSHNINLRVCQPFF